MRRIGLVGLVAARCGVDPATAPWVGSHLAARCGIDPATVPWGPSTTAVRLAPVGTRRGRVEFGHGAGDAVCARGLAGPR